MKHLHCLNCGRIFSAVPTERAIARMVQSFTDHRRYCHPPAQPLEVVDHLEVAQ